METASLFFFFFNIIKKMHWERAVLTTGPPEKGLLSVKGNKA